MAIGNLDRRVLLQNYTATQNEFGETVNTWATFKTAWAWVRFKSGGEPVFATKETSQADCIFTVRYDSLITEKTRIVHEGINYNILHRAEVGRRKFLELTAQKNV